MISKKANNKECAPKFIFLNELRLGAQSVTLLSTLRDPTQLRQRQCATRQQHPFFWLHIVVLFREFNFSAPIHE